MQAMWQHGPEPAHVVLSRPARTPWALAPAASPARQCHCWSGLHQPFLCRLQLFCWSLQPPPSHASWVTPTQCQCRIA